MIFKTRKSHKLSPRNENKKRALMDIICYFILIGIGFVYLYPIIYMVLMSVMPTEDLINPTIKWIPNSIDFESFKTVYKALDYKDSLLITLLIAGVCSIFQTITSALAGYALARFQTPFKKLWIFLLLVVFIIPSDVVSVPRFVLFTRYNMVGSLFSMFLPAFFGQGLKSSLFVLLFMYSFASYPKSYDEAAQLDGAGSLKIFSRVALPLTVPMIILTALFTFIWYWNETAQSGLLLSGSYDTLPLKLEQFDSTYGQMFGTSFGSEANRLNERIQMAATILAISPLALLYFVIKKGMINGIESSGITGE